VSSSLTAARRVHRIFGPTFVTIAKRPSYRAETRRNVHLICPTVQADSFYQKGWTGFCKVRPSGKSAARRMD
jgi:hypothetical protein